MSGADGPPPGDAVFDAVIFDMDGVLVDTEPIWEAVRAAYARRHGRGWGPEDHPVVAGKSSREWAAAMRAHLGIEAGEDEIERAIVDGVVDVLRREGAPPVHGAADAARRISGWTRTALASSAHGEIIAATLAAVGLDGTFDAVVSSDDVARGKPHPDVFLEAARRVAAPPERSLVVEDSLAGVLAGRAAGMTVLLVPSPSFPPPPLATETADWVLDRLDRLDRPTPAALAAVARRGGTR
ncbi:MAG: HAD family phosphatase [Chloroflexi bacterium]|nr:HAD family phosphatase [Chloroflexota bacterium]